MPDDAFYYLVPARNFVETGRWTFDGTSSTTGFHLAFAYWTAFCQWLAPQASFFTLELTQSLVGGTALLGSVVLVWWSIHPAWRLSFGVAAALVFSMPDVAALGTSMMESPFVIITAAMFLSWMLRSETRGRRSVALALGVIGSLARSDFILLPLSFLLAGGGLAGAKLMPRALCYRPLLVMAGSTAGLFLIMLHNLVLSGHAWQGNALVKSYWATHYPRTPFPFSYILAHAVLPALESLPLELCFRLSFILVGMFIVVVGYLVLRSVDASATKQLTREQFTVLGSLAAVASYIALYTIEAPAVQDWYVATAILPLTMGLCAAIRILPKSPSNIAPIISFVVGVVALGWQTTNVPPIQSELLPTAEYLASHPVPEPIAAWNAGILSYFSGKHIVNLDGLMNDDVVPFVLAGNFVGYLDQRHIRTIIDSTSMLEAPDLQARGGYPCGVLARRVDRLKLFETPAEPGAWRWRDGGEALYGVLTTPPDYRVGARIDFRASGDAYRYKGCGWDIPERQGTAPDRSGQPASLVLPLAPTAEHRPPRFRFIMVGSHLSAATIHVHDKAIALHLEQEGSEDRMISDPLNASDRSPLIIDIDLHEMLEGLPVVTSASLDYVPPPYDSPVSK